MYIDTHVHLNNEDIYNHLEEVVNDAISNNVKKLIVVGYDLKTSYLAIEIAKKYDFCFCAVGFHPTEIKHYGEEEYKKLEEMLKFEKVVAIGEVGYDFHWDKTTKEEQEKAFIKQIEIAKKHKLPLIIHSRDATQLTFDTLKEQNASTIGGVMHSYSGSMEMAKEFVKLNFLIGISGVVTFKNARSMVDVVQEIDLKYLISETDSPYLTPHPYRGKENGPKYIPLIVEKIAEIKKLPVDEVKLEIEKNVKKLFGV